MAAHGEPSSAATRRLAGALLDDVERIARRSVARMREQLPSYAEVPAKALLPVTLTNTRNLLQAICRPDADHLSADRHFQRSGETRLSQGVSADEMLQAWRIGLEVVREEAHPVAERLGVSDADLLEFVEASLQWGDLGMRVSAAAHREGEIRQLERLAAEQSALARVATLVAKEHSPYDLFAILAEELGRLLEVDAASILRYETDASATVVAGWSKGTVSLPLGARLPLAGDNLAGEVYRTGAPQRKEDYDEAPGPIAATMRELGFRAAVANPIVVEGATWGVIAVLSRQREPLAPDTEARITEFTRHAGIAVANAKSRADLAASRERIVRAGDEARRRLERDLHDGAQQRLVSLGLQLRAAEATVAPEHREVRHALARVAAACDEVLDDLRKLSQGLHPAVLSDGGLTPALRLLARRSAVPVTLRLEVGDERFDEPVEVTAYYVAAEALTNTAKHAQAGRIDMSATRLQNRLELTVRDNGRGGADASNGTGLTGLVDRVEAIGGTIRIDSPPRLGTVIHVRLPVMLRGA